MIEGFIEDTQNVDFPHYNKQKIWKKNPSVLNRAFTFCGLEKPEKLSRESFLKFQPIVRLTVRSMNPKGLLHRNH